MSGPDAGRVATLTGLLVEELTPDPVTRPGQVGPGGGRVVVDEKQRLDVECIEYLRYLHDHRATAFTLLLVVGGQRLAGVVAGADAALADLPSGAVHAVTGKQVWPDPDP